MLIIFGESKDVSNVSEIPSIKAKRVQRVNNDIER